MSAEHLDDVVTARLPRRDAIAPDAPDGWRTVQRDASRQVFASPTAVDGCRATIVLQTIAVDPPPDPRAVAARLLAATVAAHEGATVLHRSFGTLDGRTIAFQVLEVGAGRQIAAAWAARGGRTFVASATCAPAEEDRVGAALLALVRKVAV